jgi:hypothetical protein
MILLLPDGCQVLTISFALFMGKLKKPAILQSRFFFIADVEAAQVENHKYFLKLSQC